MTTTVTIKANHGWPVSVVAVDLPSGDKRPPVIVEANTVRDFYVHSNMDLFIHEIQPNENAEAENA